MHIVSLSLVYPNPGEPGLGLFVRARLAALARHMGVTVVAPVPLLDYSNPERRWFGQNGVASFRQADNIDVYHPRWAFPPGGTPLNVLCLVGRLLPLLWSIYRKKSFDLIDAHFGYPEGVAAAILAKIFNRPFVVTLRGSETAFGEYRWRRLCMKWALPKAAAVITVSKLLGDFAISLGADAKRVHIIPNGVNADTLYPRNYAGVRQKLGIGPNTQVILSAGELIEAKGHHLIIRSVRALADSGHNATLLIAGDVARGGRAFNQELRRLVQELGLEDRVRFLGWCDRDRMAELMSAADVFCLASFSEGWPNVVNEALACGAPVVVSRVGAVPQMIPNDRYGLIVPPGDQNSLTSALLQALGKKWDRAVISEWGRSRSWEQVALEVLELLESVSGRTQEAGLASEESLEATGTRS